MTCTRVLLLACLIGSMLGGRANAQTTTTTTLLPITCSPDDRSFAGLRCQLEALTRRVADARDAGALGRFGPGLLRRLEKARLGLDQAALTCAGGNTKRARKRVQAIARQVLETRAVIRSNNGRKVISAQVGRSLADEAATVGSELRHLRHTLRCP